MVKQLVLALALTIPLGACNSSSGGSSNNPTRYYSSDVEGFSGAYDAPLQRFGDDDDRWFYFQVSEKGTTWTVIDYLGDTWEAKEGRTPVDCYQVSVYSLTKEDYHQVGEYVEAGYYEWAFAISSDESELLITDTFGDRYDFDKDYNFSLPFNHEMCTVEQLEENNPQTYGTNSL